MGRGVYAEEAATWEAIEEASGLRMCGHLRFQMLEGVYQVARVYCSSEEHSANDNWMPCSSRPPINETKKKADIRCHYAYQVDLVACLSTEK